MESTSQTTEGPASVDTSTMLEQRRNRWLKVLLSWHWISSALALSALLLFTVTGITLNHSADIPANPRTTGIQTSLPTDLLIQLNESKAEQPLAVPQSLRNWLALNYEVQLGIGEVEWSDAELYVALPRPGGDAWLSVDLYSGELLYEHTDRGWIAWANDLHKGRNTGLWWRLFIDVFALVSLVFCLTGLAVLWLHARERASVWPVVGLGLLVPVLLATLTIH